MENTLGIIFSVIFGLAIGSFLNVCIFRIPQHTFFSNARSYCPTCGAPIKFYDNLPLISYIILGGKCRHCKQHISLRYPFVELATCLSFVAIFLVNGFTLVTPLYDLIISALIVMTFIDIDTHEIPNGIEIFILVLGVLSFFVPDGIIWWHKLVGLVIVSVPLFIIALLTGGIGGGDIKLMFALGLVFGIKLTIFIGLVSVVIGGIVGVIVLIKSGKDSKSKEIPFGPSIAVATFLAMLWGNTIIDMYLSLFTNLL